MLASTLATERAAALEAAAVARDREAALSASLARAEAAAVACRSAEDSAARLAADLRVRDAAVAAAQADAAAAESRLAALQSLLETVTMQRSAEVGALEAAAASMAAERDAAIAAAAAATAQRAPTAAAPAAAPSDADAAAAAAASSMQGSGGGGGDSSSRAVAAAHVRIATLQSRVHELRAALADAHTRALDGDAQSVDRRVVAALVVEFVRLQRASGRWGGHASQRSRDALSVLARMLGLGPADREAVGCDDEVVGPAEVGGSVASTVASGVAGLLGSLWGGVGSGTGARKPAAAVAGPQLSHAPSGAGSSSDGADSESPLAAHGGSLGAAFVHFLLEEVREAELAAASGGSAGSDGVTAPAAGGSGAAQPGTGDAVAHGAIATTAQLVAVDSIRSDA